MRSLPRKERTSCTRHILQVVRRRGAQFTSRVRQFEQSGNMKTIQPDHCLINTKKTSDIDETSPAAHLDSRRIWVLHNPFYCRRCTLTETSSPPSEILLYVLKYVQAKKSVSAKSPSKKAMLKQILSASAKLRHTFPYL